LILLLLGETLCRVKATLGETAFKRRFRSLSSLTRAGAWLTLGRAEPLGRASVVPN
jgi:hypothetical protein